MYTIGLSAAPPSRLGAGGQALEQLQGFSSLTDSKIAWPPFLGYCLVNAKEDGAAHRQADVPPAPWPFRRMDQIGQQQAGGKTDARNQVVEKHGPPGFFLRHLNRDDVPVLASPSAKMVSVFWLRAQARSQCRLPGAQSAPSRLVRFTPPFQCVFSSAPSLLFPALFPHTKAGKDFVQQGFTHIVPGDLAQGMKGLVQIHHA